MALTLVGSEVFVFPFLALLEAHFMYNSVQVDA